MPEPFDFAIIGAGASGMAAAVCAAECGDKVIVIEKNNMIGRKITASGNGRCNLMNSGIPRYYGDKRFAEKVLDYCTKDMLIRYWNRLGVRLCEETEGRMYPCTFSGSTISEAYRNRIRSAGINLMLQTRVEGIGKENDCFVISAGNNVIHAKRILISCGGEAYSRLGGTEDGYRLLARFYHSILPRRPALCPLTTDKKSISGLSGIRVRCTATLKNREQKPVQTEKGEVLFTEKGVSGICIMQLSRCAESGYSIELNLTDRIFPDTKDLIMFLTDYRDKIPDLSPDAILNGILMPKLSYAVMKQAGTEIKNRKAGDLSCLEIRTIAEATRKYRLTVTGNLGMPESQVTAGGADCSEFSPQTMESKIEKGVFASGEVLNVDGDCGGFNLMFATASGILAGMNGRKDGLF